MTKMTKMTKVTSVVCCVNMLQARLLRGLAVRWGGRPRPACVRIQSLKSPETAIPPHG